MLALVAWLSLWFVHSTADYMANFLSNPSPPPISPPPPPVLPPGYVEWKIDMTPSAIIAVTLASILGFCFCCVITFKFCAIVIDGSIRRGQRSQFSNQLRKV